MIFVPFYTIVFPFLGHHLEPVQAVEVGLLTEIFGFMSSTSAFWRAGLIDFQIAVFTVLFAIPAAIVGGYVAHFIPAQWMLVAIGIGLMAFAYLLFREEGDTASTETKDGLPDAPAQVRKEHRDRQGRLYRYVVRNDAWRASAVSIGGVFQGLVGFSAGELSTVEQILRGMPIRIAAGNAHLIIAGASIAAATTHLGVSLVQGSQVPWNILAASVPAVMIGGQIAALVAGRLPQHILRLVLSGFLLFVGAISLYRGGASGLLQQMHLSGWMLAIAVVLLLGGLVLRRRRGRTACRAGCCGAKSANPGDK